MGRNCRPDGGGRRIFYGRDGSLRSNPDRYYQLAGNIPAPRHRQTRVKNEFCPHEKRRKSGKREEVEEWRV